MLACNQTGIYIAGMAIRETLVDLSVYTDQIEILQRDPHTRIMGSVGRMVLAKQAIDDPYREFRDRDAAGLALGISDLDVLGASSDTLELACAVEDGVLVDSQAFDDTDVSVRYKDDAWHLISHETDFDEEIHKELMAPVVETVQGIEIVTVPFLTHRLLHTLRERDTRKDKLTESFLGYLVHQTALDLGHIPKVDQAHARPFFNLQWLLRNRPVSDDNRHSGRHSSSEL